MVQVSTIHFLVQFIAIYSSIDISEPPNFFTIPAYLTSIDYYNWMQFAQNRIHYTQLISLCFGNGFRMTMTSPTMFDNWNFIDPSHYAEDSRQILIFPSFFNFNAKKRGSIFTIFHALKKTWWTGNVHKLDSVNWKWISNKTYWNGRRNNKRTYWVFNKGDPARLNIVNFNAFCKYFGNG